MLLQTVRPNIVQSIRAYRVDELQDAAQHVGQHFLYANLSVSQSKQDVMELIAESFLFPAHFGKNLDALFDCMTDLVHKSGPQPGFVVVLEQLPDNIRFDREAREQLLDLRPPASRALVFVSGLPRCPLPSQKKRLSLTSPLVKILSTPILV
jgi:RNAse (barnase) inhibitor barstar